MEFDSTSVRSPNLSSFLQLPRSLPTGRLVSGQHARSLAVPLRGVWSAGACLEHHCASCGFVQCSPASSCRDSDTNYRSSSCPHPEPASKAQCPCEDALAPNSTSLMPAGCPKEWSEADCECCPSGIVDITGQCCSSDNAVAVVDKKGECCAAGYVDACGICGGDGVYMDRQGKCCKVFHPLETLCAFVPDS